MTFQERNPEAWERAKRQASGDLALLARLVEQGRVKRTGEPALRLPPTSRQRKGMDTIRPKSKRRRR